MGKQRCGSCRFFQDAGMAGSGWCHHPLRKTTNELLIMVRRNELACRDQWSHSLWEEGTWEPEPAPPEARTGDDPIHPGRPLLPATEGDIAALLRADRAERPPAQVGSAQEDVVLGEARLVTDRTPPWRREEPTPEPRRDYDPRTAIKKAREAYRERMRAQEAARVSALADAVPLATEGAAVPDADRPEAEDGPDPTFLPDEIDARAEPAPDAPIVFEPAASVEPATEPGDLTVAEENVSFDAAPAALDEPFDEGDRAELDADWWAGGEGDPDAPFAEWAEPEPEDEARPLESQFPAAPERAPASASPDEPSFGDSPATRASISTWFIEDVAPPPLGAIASPWSVASATRSAGSPPDDVEEAADPWRDGDYWLDDDAETTAAIVVGGEDDRSGPSSSEAWADEPGDSGEIETAPEAGEGPSLEAVATPLRPAIRLLPVGSVAPGVPRICRTCRDYRPAEGGDRGWCSNQWAFTTRQMVHPEDPAPCESSAGSWWLPTDDLCLADADVSTHGQPTPHLDRWLPHHRERAAERKRS